MTVYMAVAGDEFSRRIHQSLLLAYVQRVRRNKLHLSSFRSTVDYSDQFFDILIAIIIGQLLRLTVATKAGSVVSPGE